MKTRKLALTSLGFSIGLVGQLISQGSIACLPFDMVACYLIPFKLFLIYVILVSWNVLASLPSLPVPIAILTFTLYVPLYALFAKALTWLFLEPIMQKVILWRKK